MKITEITFSKKYSYLPYHPLTPGFVATLEEGEDPLEAMKKLDDLSKQYYETHYNPEPVHIDIDAFKKAMTETPTQFYTSKPSQPIENQPEEKITPEQGKQNTLQSINNCKSIKELETWKLLAAKDPELKEKYADKFEELSV